MRAATQITPGGLVAEATSEAKAVALATSEPAQPKDTNPKEPKTLIEQRREEFKKCDVRYNKIEIVRIKVGETLFHTTMQTLKDKSDNLMYIDATLKLHGDRFDGSLTNQLTEVYLTYDRDPKLFEYILNYLRCPETWIWPEYKLRYNVRREAEFYGVEGLVKLFPSYTKPAHELRSVLPSFVMLFEVMNPGTVKLALPMEVSRLLCEYFAIHFQDSVKTQLTKDGRAIFDYGHVYGAIDNIIRLLHAVGFRVIATANPNKTHTQYIFEAV
jgi:hypothetical protein